MAPRHAFILPSVFAALATAACIPDNSAGIAALNSSLGGRVHVNEPFALPCFSVYNGKEHEVDTELCAERQAKYTSPSYRNQFPGAYMYEQSAICASDETSEDNCLLDGNNPLNASVYGGSANCKQGNIPSYYIDVTSANDVVEAFNYARNTGGKLVIKNSGHSYVEDSSGKGALTLWTRNLGQLSHDAAFVPEGCSADETFDTITTGAGVNCGEAYEFANGEDVTIICGYSQTVGLSGGWVQGGGHSVLTNVYGLGSDRVVQFTVVTPDGSVRTANKCQNTDLFWALRGGGGGTYGVVIDSTHLVEPVVPMTVASVGIPSTNKTLYYEWMELLVDTAVELAEDGWGGHIYGNSFVHVTPKLTTVEDAEASMSKLTTFALAHGGHASITYSPTWYSFFSDFVISGSVSVGNLNIINTRLVPTNIFTDADLKADFLALLKEYIDLGGSPYVPVDSPYLWKATGDLSSAHPAWYDSLWELGFPSYWQWNSTLEERIDIAKNMQKQTEKQQAVTPGGGAYKNEASPFTSNWEEVFYGANYDELLEIKNKYDPNGLLSCWACVGWTDADASKSCYKSFVDLPPADVMTV